MAGMIRKLVVSGVAARLLQEARKPHNQQKIKDLVAQLANKRGGQGGRPPGSRGRY